MEKQPVNPLTTVAREKTAWQTKDRKVASGGKEAQKAGAPQEKPSKAWGRKSTTPFGSTRKCTRPGNREEIELKGGRELQIET